MFPAASNEAVGGDSQAIGGLLGTGGSESQSLEDTSQAVGNSSAPGGHADNGEDIANGLDVAELTSQRPVPWEGVRAVCQILVVQHLKAGSLHGGQSFLDLAHVGNTVAQLDTETDLTVVKVVVVILISHEPLVDTEDATGLQDTEDLAVDTLKSGSVDSGLDGVDGIKGVILETHLHEVALDEVKLLRQTLLGGVVGSTLDLVVVVVETSDVAASELCNLTSRATNTAADIKNSAGRRGNQSQDVWPLAGVTL